MPRQVNFVIFDQMLWLYSLARFNKVYKEKKYGILYLMDEPSTRLAVSLFNLVDLSSINCNFYSWYYLHLNTFP